jgi:hypothetical protein
VNFKLEFSISGSSKILCSTSRKSVFFGVSKQKLTTLNIKPFQLKRKEKKLLFLQPVSLIYVIV